jgi:hypothetical protein
VSTGGKKPGTKIVFSSYRGSPKANENVSSRHPNDMKLSEEVNYDPEAFFSYKSQKNVGRR